MVYFYTIGDRRIASSRLRIWHVQERLTGSSIVTVIAPRLSYSDRFKCIHRLLSRILYESSAIFYVHKIVNPPEIVLLFVLARKIFHRRVIFDFDDEREGVWARLMIRNASSVVVSSHALLEDAKKLNVKSVLIPTTVPLEIYNPRADISTSKPVIGWIGSAKGQKESLALLIPVFQKLISEKIAFTFLLVGAQNDIEVRSMFNAIEGMELEIIDEVDWSQEGAIANIIQRFDVGVMPLVDTPRNRKKAGLKLIQYMALGLPVVASAVGENTFVVQDGDNGFLARTSNDWKEALKKLIHDEKLRATLGERGRKRVEGEYALGAYLSRYENIIHQS